MSHRHVLLRAILTLVCLLSCSLLTSVVLADDELAARASFERGVEASREERWSDARAQFQRSLELVPKASTLFNLVIADIKLGLGREALEHLDAFERTASPEEHKGMIARARVLRPQARALVESEQAKAQNGGNALSEGDDGLSAASRAEVEAARKLYAQGRDREALLAFERAYRTSNRPELLYNIGVVADRMRADARAVRAYEAFIAALPDAPEAAVAQVRSDALRAALLARERDAQPELAAQVPLPAAPPPPQEHAAQGRSGELIAPRALLASAVLVTGGAFGVVGYLVYWLDGYNECKDRRALSAAVQTVPEERQVCTNPGELEAERPAVIRSLATAATLGSVAAVATVVSAVWLARRKRASTEHALAPWFAPQAAGLTLTHTF